MVDTNDLFKKLGSGATFDLKRFKDDADQFQVRFLFSQHTGTWINEAALLQFLEFESNCISYVVEIKMYFFYI